MYKGFAVLVADLALYSCCSIEEFFFKRVCRSQITASTSLPQPQGLLGMVSIKT